MRNYALSLVDTYWVRPVGGDLCWSDISLYTHKFNKQIAKAAFDGELCRCGFYSVSPKFSTDGTFAKCWLRQGETIKLLKRGSSGARNAGLEPFSEFYASQVSKALGLNAISYSITKHYGKLCSACDAFTSESVGFIPYCILDPTSSTLASVLKYCQKYGLEEEVKEMFLFDSVIFNEDRHKGNFGFLVDNDSGRVLGMIPLFNHNISLLCYAEMQDFRSADYLETRFPCIGKDFVKDARQLLSTRFRRRLCDLEDFRFQRDPLYNLPSERFEVLESIINKRIREIVKQL